MSESLRTAGDSRRSDEAQRGELCSMPTGVEGRCYTSLSMAHTQQVLTCAQGQRMHDYIVLSLLTGARTEELRALRWEHVHLDHPTPHVEVWRSVRSDGDTKTRRSRRTLALPHRCVEALRAQEQQLADERTAVGAS